MTEGGGEVMIMLVAMLAGVALLSLAMLKAWDGWLRLRRLELTQGRPARLTPAMERLALIDLKDRVRRLEAIANGAED